MTEYKEIIKEVLAEAGKKDLTSEIEDMISYAADVIASDEVASARPILEEIEGAPLDIAERVAVAIAARIGTVESASTEALPRRIKQNSRLVFDAAATVAEVSPEERSPEIKSIKNKRNTKKHTGKKQMMSEEDQQEALDEIDDFASAWRECQASGRVWGGRGFGGRGVARQYQTMSTASRDVVIDGVTLAFAGKELLKRSTLRLVQGRKYCLIGANGVGKSTLLRRIATHSLPGFPPHLRVGYLAQEAPNLSEDELEISAVDALVRGACGRRRQLLEGERDDLENQLSTSNCNDDCYETIASRLCELEAELEALLEDGSAKKKAEKALTSLGFDKIMRNKKAAELSGGWRKRVEIAAAIIEQPDILLIDEASNHLDLEGVLWLEQYLQNASCTQLIVSHDRAFVAAVATDIIVFEDLQLRYFAGDLATFEMRQVEKNSAQQHRLDARVRQETAAREAAEKMRRAATSQKKSKGTNDNALRAAKQRLAKIERIGLYRDDGHRFKTHSLSEMSDKGMRLPEKVEPKRAAKQFSFTLPSPTPLSISTAYVSLDGVDIGHTHALLTNVIASLVPGSRVALVGPNGTGKTTLLRTIAGILPTRKGEVRLGHPNLRLAYVPQDHVEYLQLDTYISTSASTYLMDRFQISEIEARARLGKFGIPEIAKLSLTKCSGGQKARLALACATYYAPHVLLLDEPTNHLSSAALDALAAALNGYTDAAIVVISHNRAFLSACCNELWSIDDAKTLTTHRDADFSILFAAYADRVLHSGTGGLSGSTQSRATAADAQRLGRKAGALDAAAAAAATKKGINKLGMAGAAANRAALI